MYSFYSGLTLNQYGVASPCRTGLKLIHYKTRNTGRNCVARFICLSLRLSDAARFLYRLFLPLGSKISLR